MIDLIYGIIIGVAVVGSSVQKTLNVYEGNVWGALISNVINSASYFASVYFVAKDNITAFVGTCIGSAFIISYLAYRNRRKHEDIDQKIERSRK